MSFVGWRSGGLVRVRVAGAGDRQGEGLRTPGAVGRWRAVLPVLHRASNQTADVHHSRVWRRELERVLETSPDTSEEALDAAESAAKGLWKALDGIEERRQARKAARDQSVASCA